MLGDGPLRDVHADAGYSAHADTDSTAADGDADPVAADADRHADEHTGSPDAVGAELPDGRAERAGRVDAERGAGLQPELAMRGHG